MKFLTNKEKSLLSLINHDKSINQAEKLELTENIKQNARLRSDGFRPKVKIALCVIANHNNDKLFNKYIK